MKRRQLVQKEGHLVSLMYIQKEENIHSDK